MKVVFFDTKPYEKKYLEENLDPLFEKIFYSAPLNCFFQIEDEIKDAEVISCFITSDLSRKVLENFPNLKFIVLRSVGYSHVDLFYAKERNISIFNAPHYGDFSIAEYVFALLLSAVRKINEAAYDVKTQNVNELKYRGMEIYNKTMGIVGLGSIGKQVAKIAKSFHMEVIYYDIVKDDEFTYVSLDELSKRADIISINCPLTENTLHMFDANRFCSLKDGVVIINTARGEIINSEALYNALISKKVSFAALDVTECENLLYEDRENRIDVKTIKENCFKNYYITRKLLNMDNVIVTPHIAYNTMQAGNRILEITVENLISLTKFTIGAKNLVLI